MKPLELIKIAEKIRLIAVELGCRKVILHDLADEDGWTFLGELGNMLLKKQPDFDPRNYGFSKMISLIKSTNKFLIDERTTGKNNNKLVYIKIK